MALVHKLGWDPLFMQRNPWFWPFARAQDHIAGSSEWPLLRDFDVLYAELTAHAAGPALRFRPNVRKQDKRTQGRVVLDALYDARITLRGDVPTREGDWHDLFNFLCFATFPRAKLALHQRQYEVLQRRLSPEATAMPSARTPEQDALTLFDEGGVAVAADTHAIRALEHADVASLAHVLEGLERAGHARVVPFGHALFEHLVEGLVCPGGGTRVVRLDPLPDHDDALLEAVDRALCALLQDPRCFLSPKEHLHLRFNCMQPPSARARRTARSVPSSIRSDQRDQPGDTEHDHDCGERVDEQVGVEGHAARQSRGSV
jgi:hypothetical protein